MQLSTAQLQALKTWVIANASGVFDQATANTLNAIASPDFWVWRTSVTKAECVQTASVDGTTFNWVGNGFITRSVGEQTAWRELFNHTESVNPSLANVRQAFADIFSGTGNAAANRTHLLTIARRKATLGEKTLGNGTGSTANPATMGSGAEGEVTLQNLVDASNS